jgi:uncharacterized protein
MATALPARPTQVAAAIELLDGGATVPFIARYRKEATGTLDEDQLRNIQSLLEEHLLQASNAQQHPLFQYMR